MRNNPETLTDVLPADGMHTPFDVRKEVTTHLRAGGSDAPSVGLRDRVLALQDRMFAMAEHHIAIEPVHRFAHGLYAREVTLPAGCTAIGYAHAQEHVCIISQGRVQIVTEAGVEEISAPATLIIPRGRKNCVHALETTVWTTIHATPATSVEEAEATLIMPDEEAMKCLS